MATDTSVTDGTVRATTAAGSVTQPINQALDVSKGDQLDLILQVVAVEGVVTTFIVSIITGMTLESEDAWVEVGAFATHTTAPLCEKMNFSGLGKYVRWKVKTITGGTAVTFSIRGMLRNN